jgi:AraC-like DNA-binding protein
MPFARDGAAGGMIVVGHQSARTSPERMRGTITHTYAVLAFFTRGRMRLELNGEWTLVAGDVLLVPPGAPHRTLDRDLADVWMLRLCVPCFAAAGSLALLAPFERVRDGAAAVVNIPRERRAFLASLFGELNALKTSDTYDAVQQSLVTLILAEVARATGKGVHRNLAGGMVVDALRFIERNCLGRLTPRDVAAEVKRTPAYLTTALKQATGRSAGEWIVAGRMAEARRLLLHSDERVDVIAERVGYADPTHFIRMFRRDHGATPAAWRSRQRLRP